MEYNKVATISSTQQNRGAYCWHWGVVWHWGAWVVGRPLSQALASPLIWSQDRLGISIELATGMVLRHTLPIPGYEKHGAHPEEARGAGQGHEGCQGQGLV